ncbi:hypothetical protein [Streptomyces flavalbus]|uniref:Uncharacterized protein n=1 Tax=Streptomyces flavalbus TaxID=2665155 RepID=A0ABW2W9L2_9ACTN
MPLATRFPLGHGLRASLRNNGQAYGFSVSITTAGALLSVEAEPSGALPVVWFALAAALAFSVLEALATRGFRRPLEPEPSTVTALGVSFGLFSVGVSVGAAWLVAHFVGGTVAWPLTAFLVSLGYPTVAGLELAVAQRAQEATQRAEGEGEADEEGAGEGET